MYKLTDEIIEKITVARSKKKLKQYQVSQMVGLHKNSYSRIEKGKQEQIRENVLKKIAEVLELDINDLIKDPNIEPKLTEEEKIKYNFISEVENLIIKYNLVNEEYANFYADKLWHNLIQSKILTEKIQIQKLNNEHLRVF